MSVAAVGSFIPLVQAALAPLASGTSKAAQKAREAAKEFESLLAGELLKQSRRTLGEEGGFFATDKADTYGALFDFFLGKHLADSDGLSVARAIERHLTVNQQR